MPHLLEVTAEHGNLDQEVENESENVQEAVNRNGNGGRIEAKLSGITGIEENVNESESEIEISENVKEIGSVIVNVNVSEIENEWQHHLMRVIVNEAVHIDNIRINDIHPERRFHRQHHRDLRLATVDGLILLREHIHLWIRSSELEEVSVVNIISNLHRLHTTLIVNNKPRLRRLHGLDRWLVMTMTCSHIVCDPQAFLAIKVDLQ